MNFGFLIDNASCIGCHACSTACKSENEVPLGVYRTWVKYTEQGVYPDVRRSFQVTRCNHCNNPPCARICPTTAMYQRDDGIVEFDSDACIGCKACMQACPYDAIHLDPETRTAAKCHFCSHRVDVGLEPACVVVCPEHAILSGDLDDPTSEISQRIAKHDVTVRKPEQGTAPKLFYIEGNALTLHPSALERTPTAHMFGDVVPLHGGASHGAPPPSPVRHRQADHGRIRTPDVQGTPAAGPIHLGGNAAAHMVQVGYNAQHRIQWHWPIPAYIVTKHIAAGIFLTLAATAFGWPTVFEPTAMVWGGALSILMGLVTLGLLIYDLDRPDRFFYLLIRPQWRSWVARAAWILAGFQTLSGVWWALETAAWFGLANPGFAEVARPVLALLIVPFAWMAAIYTAFLFGQAEGRDLWQGTHLPVQMTVQAMVFASSPFVAMAPFLDLPSALVTTCSIGMGLALLASLGITLVADLAFPHPSEVARRAARDMTHGNYRTWFWLGGIVIGHLVPLAMLGTGVPALGTVAFFAAAAGAFAYAYALVMAPQDIPNS